MKTKGTTLKTYWTGLDPAAKERYAAKIGTRVNVVTQIVHGHVGISPKRAAKMAEASGGKLTKEQVLLEVSFG